MHKEYINARRLDTFFYKIGYYIRVRWQIKYNAKKGIIGQLKFQYTIPWKVVNIPQDSSYNVRHCCKHNTMDNKKASKLSPYRDKLIAMPPLAGCDTSLRELNKSLLKNPCHEYGLHNYNKNILMILYQQIF